MSRLSTFVLPLLLMATLSAYAYIEGPIMNTEPTPDFDFENTYYEPWNNPSGAVLTSTLFYTDDKPGFGGMYEGELAVPSHVISNMTGESVEVVAIAHFYRNGVTVLRLPETIQEIYNTINDCKLLREVYLNDNLKVLNGIYNCPYLTVCPLPSALEYVGRYSMSRIGIKKIDFPPMLTEIGEKSFSHNYQLETLDLGNLAIAADSCFRNLPLLKEVILPESLESLGSACFEYCWNIERVTLPSHPINAPKDCFNMCPAIMYVTSLAETPYEFQGYMWNLINSAPYSDSGKTILYVPDESVDIYKNSDGWNRFNVQPLSKSGVKSTQTSKEESWEAEAKDGDLVIKSKMRQQINVYDMAGSKVATITQPGKTVLSLNRGIYAVSTKNECLKIMVK